MFNSCLIYIGQEEIDVIEHISTHVVEVPAL
jgi:hypothetical protein